MLLNTPKKGSLEAFGGDESNHGKASDSPFESIFSLMLLLLEDFPLDNRDKLKSRKEKNIFFPLDVTYV